MLLNRALTVRPGEAASHRGRGWEEVTECAIHALAGRGGPLVAVLWGRDAQGLKPMLGPVPWVESAHPSPLSANRGLLRLPAVQPGERAAGRAGRPRGGLATSGLTPSGAAGATVSGVSSVRRLVVALAALVAVTVFGTVGYLLLGFTLLEARLPDRHHRRHGRLPRGAAADHGRDGLHDRADRRRRRHRPLQPRRDPRDRHRGPAPPAPGKATHGQRASQPCAGTSSSAATGGSAGRPPTSWRRRATRSWSSTPTAARLADLPPDVPHLIGDVTEDRVLREAGLEHARAVVVALDTDADTVYATLSARAMRPDVVIVARARTTDSKAKLHARRGHPRGQPAAHRRAAAGGVRAPAATSRSSSTW